MILQTSKLVRQGNIALLPAISLLARKLLKQTWRLLLITLCGMVACVGLVCATPLFAQVSIQSGLQRVLDQDSQEKMITEYVSSDHPTTTQIQQTGQRIDTVFQSNLAPYLGGAAQFSLKTPALQVLDTTTGKAASQSVNVFGYDPSQSSKQVTVLKGRLPQAAPNEIEVALTQSVANKLGLQVGTLQQVRYPVAAGSIVWHLRVVGIIALLPSAGDFWHNASMDGNDPSILNNNLLASLPAILPQVSAIQIVQQTANNPTPVPQPLAALTKTSTTDVLVQTTTSPATMRPLQFTRSNSGGSVSPQFSLYWKYPIALAHIDGNNLNSVLQPYQNMSTQLNGLTQDSHILFQVIESPFMNHLGDYQHYIPYAQVLIILLLVSTFAMALFMVSLLANVLVEHQLATIVMLRSRGASQRHIFGAFTLQGLLLSLIALLLGPAFAILLVCIIGQILMPATAQSAFAVLSNNLAHTIAQIWIFALSTVLVALVVMIISLRRASHIDIVALRQNTSRVRQVPLWKRLYLDCILGAIIVVGMVYYQFLAKTRIATSISLSPLAFLAVPIILLTVALLFLRFFPLLTRLGTRLMTKSNAVPGVLAFAQMERQPHATLRMILLLALALASSIYLLSFIATQQYRVQQIAGYQVGADFSGKISVSNPSQTLTDIQAHYASVPGVTTATPGYHDIIDTTNTQVNPPQIVVNAVNADTYVHMVSSTTQSLKPLTDQLVAQRSSAIAQDQVPVIVDLRLAEYMQLSAGATFTIVTDNIHWQNIHFIVLTETNYLPQAQDTTTSGQSLALPNMLMDYQNYAAVYAKDHHGTQVQPNYLWLNTLDDAHSLSQVRKAFPAFLDRRAIIQQATTEPLQIAIQGTLILGLIIACALVLIGVGLTAWLSVKQRRMSFSILRALGMTPGQIAQILLWEQGVTYLSALLVGLGIGWLSSLLVVPAFALVDYILQAISVAFANIQLPLERSASIPITWIGLMLATFVVICGTVLFLVSRYGAQPALSQTLRLNED